MRSLSRFSFAFVGLLAVQAVLVGPALGQVGYGVDNDGGLFRFDLLNPNNAVTSIGFMSFAPEGIDFRPGTNTLYAINIDTLDSKMKLYTVDITTAAATQIGTGFSLSGSVNNVAYDITTARTFGFDFNPTTLQGDGSIRIRLVADNGTNMRLNSATGQIAAVDTSLAYVAGDTNAGTVPLVDAAAYINSNAATAGGTTQLFVLDYGTDDLSLQNPPNGGVLNTLGPIGVTVNALPNVGFDILTDVGSVDTTIGGDHGYAVFRRPEVTGAPGPWLLYDVNLGSGQVTNGALVGINSGSSADFTGGLAVIIPEPTSIVLVLVGLIGLALRKR